MGALQPVSLVLVCRLPVRAAGPRPGLPRHYPSVCGAGVAGWGIPTALGGWDSEGRSFLSKALGPREGKGSIPELAGEWIPWAGREPLHGDWLHQTPSAYLPIQHELVLLRAGQRELQTSGQ